MENQETKYDLPTENRETKNEESPAPDEATEKEAKSYQHHIPCLISGLSLPSCTVQHRKIMVLDHQLRKICLKRLSWKVTAMTH